MLPDHDQTALPPTAPPRDRSAEELLEVIRRKAIEGFINYARTRQGCALRWVDTQGQFQTDVLPEHITEYLAETYGYTSAPK